MSADTRAPDSAQTATAGRYDPDVAKSEHAVAAERAIARMAKAQAALDAARGDRDDAIEAMHRVDGMTAPQIARALDVSTSLIRLTLKLRGWA